MPSLLATFSVAEGARRALASGLVPLVQRAHLLPCTCWGWPGLERDSGSVSKQPYSAVCLRRTLWLEHYQIAC
jgi:hypothetical protein